MNDEQLEAERIIEELFQYAIQDKTNYTSDLERISKMSEYFTKIKDAHIKLHALSGTKCHKSNLTLKDATLLLEKMSKTIWEASKIFEILEEKYYPRLLQTTRPLSNLTLKEVVLLSEQAKKILAESEIILETKNVSHKNLGGGDHVLKLISKTKCLQPENLHEITCEIVKKIRDNYKIGTSKFTNFLKTLKLYPSYKTERLKDFFEILKTYPNEFELCKIREDEIKILLQVQNTNVLSDITQILKDNKCCIKFNDQFSEEQFNRLLGIAENI